MTLIVAAANTQNAILVSDRRFSTAGGKYIVIWKLEPTGEWRIHRDIFNWDIPPAEGSTA